MEEKPLYIMVTGKLPTISGLFYGGKISEEQATIYIKQVNIENFFLSKREKKNLREVFSINMPRIQGTSEEGYISMEKMLTSFSEHEIMLLVPKKRGIKWEYFLYHYRRLKEIESE